VIFSRQIATLFEAQVSALKAFTMLAVNTENKLLGRKLTQIGDDLQSGISISGALAKHPDVFSNFYVNMVKVGEETGKLNQTFLYFSGLFGSAIRAHFQNQKRAYLSGFRGRHFFCGDDFDVHDCDSQTSFDYFRRRSICAIFTQVVIDVSNLFVNYGFFALIFLVLLGIWIWRLASTARGKVYLDSLKLSMPILGDLYQKLYLSRITDNLNTMLSSGIPIVRAIDITAEVVGSLIYKNILAEVADGVKSGLALSAAFEKHTNYIPAILVQMTQVGEETGSLGAILKTLTTFYAREVDGAVDTLVGLIEPVMIVVLGVGWASFWFLFWVLFTI